jgi:hypothetical protein
MREHRWESQETLSFLELVALTETLQRKGLTNMHPKKELIGYIEEWEVSQPEQIEYLDAWPTEDVTLLHLLDHWQGDFFLLAGRYHTVFQQYQSVNTYCSIAHPWRIERALATIQPLAWFWVGFRHTHGFIRVRVQTTEIVAPGETVEPPRDQFWLKDRQEAFQEAIESVDLPLQVQLQDRKVILRTDRTDSPLFCSWPDAFGPCQFELNSPDPYEFLVPGSQLAASMRDQQKEVRVYMTGFPPEALSAYNATVPNPRLMYRCSIHCRLEEIPEIFDLLQAKGRLYGSLAEFQTGKILANGTDAATIIGLVGFEGQWRLEVRLNQLPLAKQETEQWLEKLVGRLLIYSPLPAFP